MKLPIAPLNRIASVPATSRVRKIGREFAEPSVICIIFISPRTEQIHTPSLGLTPYTPIGLLTDMNVVQTSELQSTLGMPDTFTTFDRRPSMPLLRRSVA